MSTGTGTFKGGVHPYDGKDLSKDLPTLTVMPKGDLVFPMAQQHLGAPSRPVVAVGDKVLMGQRIGEASGFISAHICSSVSGTVKAIEPRLTPSSAMVESIVIENDGQYTPAPGVGEKRDYTKMSKEEIRAAVKDAGVVGMGGAGFPTHVKITPKDDNAIDFIIANCAECEPYLTSDYRMMLEEPDRLIGGLNVIVSLFPNAKGVIAVEDNKPDAIKLLQEKVKDEPKIEVQVLQTKYPQGSERQLIYACTGRKINSSMLPADAGCIVDNCDTVIAIYRAVCESTPLMRRVVTVTGDAVNKPRNVIVKTGTLYSELLEYVDGFKCQPEKVISGGPMMGQAQTSLDVPVTKISSALLCMEKDPVSQYESTHCIRCGRCVAACPSRLVPQKLYECSTRGDIDTFAKLNGMECFECGACTYVCPAKLRLTQAFKQSRRAVQDARRKAQAAAQAAKAEAEAKAKADVKKEGGEKA
ncbi:electron transport complex subunit RsxC [Cuneatibacter sp. NSJ-177]|uniref:electron transport complex subunit RsxC n=1 Tax=Cuneatibacter sp. NSJ-177 TaxID=2931401 RepID=UPI001FD0A155|nr:electron transport complex subunit RsxC [Cuneatibacter sp. NSJ-177]MCJ7834135.1 electron transport complex subunit RsxC [Cuneatibacter sp. NSJ-177]